MHKFKFIGDTVMKNGKNPDPNVIHPIAGYDKEIYVKNQRRGAKPEVSLAIKMGRLKTRS